MAYLKALETRHNPDDRFRIKVELTRLLYDQGFSRKDILELFRFIDWVMQLPAELESKFASTIHEIEEAQKMKYITSIERMGIEKGMEKGMQKGMQRGLMEGIRLALEIKFGEEGKRELPKIKKIKNLAQLRVVSEAIKTVQTLDELRKIYAKKL